MLADTIAGYTSIFFFYLGKKRTEITYISKSVSYAVVFNLLPDFLIMDSFDTTYNLVNDLIKKQVYVIGAVRSNSSAMPTVFRKKRWMRENCKSRRFQMAQGRQICDCTVERL